MSTEDRDREVRELCERLTADPIFAMSLGSKELFHSNLLGWFLEHHPGVAEAVARAWSLPGSVEGLRVEREQRHLDLLVEVPGYASIVVENKMFALPDEAQLDRYATSHLGHVTGEAQLVLLSLTDPGWSGGTWDSAGRTWVWRRYDELRALLLSAEPAVRTESPYAADTLVGWCRLLGDLGDLAIMVGEPQDDEPLLLDSVTRSSLSAVRLDAPVQKMRCQFVARQIRRRLGPEVTAQVKIEATLSNMQGVVQGYAGHPDPEGALVGWQLQGDQFRLQMVLDGPTYRGTTPEMRHRRVEFARQRLAWFDFTLLRQITRSTAAERPVDTSEGLLAFNRFDPNFVYRYLPVPGITVGEATAAGFAYCRAALGKSRRSEAPDRSTDDHDAPTRALSRGSARRSDACFNGFSAGRFIVASEAKMPRQRGALNGGMGRAHQRAASKRELDRTAALAVDTERLSTPSGGPVAVAPSSRSYWPLRHPR